MGIALGNKPGGKYPDNSSDTLTSYSSSPDEIEDDRTERDNQNKHPRKTRTMREGAKDPYELGDGYTNDEGQKTKPGSHGIQRLMKYYH